MVDLLLAFKGVEWNLVDILERNYIVEKESVIYESPGYDHSPVVHDGYCDDEKPVVIQTPSRINNKYFFGPVKTENKSVNKMN